MKETIRRKCATMQGFFGLVDDYPQYRSNLNKIARQQEEFISHQQDNNETLIIQVVVHVVYKNERENISDGHIHRQIEQLTKDFLGLNNDLSKVPTPFQASVGKANIKFILADTDEHGDSTNGITRTKTNVSSFSSDSNNIKFSSMGGKDAWDTQKYLNIWVGNIERNILGYAQFPGGPALTDGVVINTSSFGIGHPAEAPFDKGRTLTHEVGHYLNLSHIWGESLFNNCYDDDHVTDTPTQKGPNRDKPNFPVHSCPNQPNGDMYMNYMDYVDDEAMFMFTKDQVARMRSVLFNERSALVNAMTAV